jgi:FSR family fosmidomycin resistance protein-like MFS transporter
MVVDMQTSSLAVLIPLLYVSFKLDYAAAALIITLNSLASSIIQPLFGLISDRKSLRWLLPVGCLLTALGMILVLFMPDYWLVLVVVVISGLGSAAFHPEGSRNANYVSGKQKATGLSIFFVGGNLGFTLGPIMVTVLIGLMGPGGTVFMLVPALLGTILLWYLLPLYATYAAEGQALARRAKITNVQPNSKIAGPLTLLISIISFRSMVQTGLVTFIPLYFLSLSDNNKDYAAFLLAVFLFAGAVGTLVGGRLADRIERKFLMAGSLAIVTPMLFIFLNSTGLIQVISLAITGATLISASSLTVVIAQELLPNNVGLASGLTLGLAFGTGGLGAAALGKYADFFGLSQTMLILTLLPILVVVLSLMMPSKKPIQMASQAQTELVYGTLHKSRD